MTPGRKDVYNRTHQFSYVRLCGSLPGDVGLRIFTGRETEKQENAALRNMPVTLIRRTFVTVTPVMALLTFAISAQAGSLVLNGDFENVTNGSGGMGDSAVQPTQPLRTGRRTLTTSFSQPGLRTLPGPMA